MGATAAEINYGPYKSERHGQVRGNQASKMTRHCVGVLSIQGVLDQPSQSKPGPVNLQKLSLLAFGDESALLIVDCQDEGGGAHKQMSTTRLSTSFIASSNWIDERGVFETPYRASIL
ncbi:MAG: hypothetical protein AUF67_08005 [Acidobacteria bacterium 13_1_20CM_58_21]|nr:MAG: hypothetical protein AUF67_08005 [Acidobacteria bacterium 13_1_20CM_58_21]